jgi:hypothetical protein
MTNLAIEMNVTHNDLMSLAVNTVNCIKADGMAATFLASSEELRVELCSAYMVAACKKMDKFITRYLTSEDVRNTLAKAIILSIKEAE